MKEHVFKRKKKMRDQSVMNQRSKIRLKRLRLKRMGAAAVAPVVVAAGAAGFTGGVDGEAAAAAPVVVAAGAAPVVVAAGGAGGAGVAAGGAGGAGVAAVGPGVAAAAADCAGCAGCGYCVADQLLGLELAPSMGDGGVPPPSLLCLARDDASMGVPLPRFASDFFGCIGCVGQVEECKFRQRVNGVRMYFPCGGCAECDWDETWQCYVKTKIVTYTGDAPTRHCCTKFKDMCRVEMIDTARSLGLATEDMFCCYGCHRGYALEDVFLGHVQAASEGGSFLPANIRPTCGQCEKKNGAEYMWPGKFCRRCNKGRHCSCFEMYGRWPT